MKKLLVFAGLLAGLLSCLQGGAQCRPCPEQFTLQDSGCTRIIISQTANGWFASDSIRACQGSTVTYSLTAGIPGCSYPGVTYTIAVLSGGTLLSSGGGNFTVNWGSGGSGLIRVHYQYNNGSGTVCDGVFFVQVLLTPNPVAAFTAAPNPACFNNPTAISFNASASTGASNYFWDFGDGFQGVGIMPVHNYALPGTYTVTLIVSTPTAPGGGGNGSAPRPCPECSDTAQLQVVINNLPGPPIDCIGTVCADETATYCTSATGCSGYTWTVTGGVILSGQNTPCITVLWGNGNPQGSINLVVSGCPGYCPQGTTVAVPIIPPVGTITGDTVACVGASSSYSLPSWPGVFYNWSLSGGGTISGNNTNTAQVTVAWTTPGTYTLNCSYYDSSAQCGGSASLTVQIRPKASISGNNQICAGSTVTLSSTVPVSTPVSSSWSISSGVASFISGSTGSSVTLTSNTPGVFTVSANPGSAACNTPSFTVTVLAKPILGPITGRDSICPGSTNVYAVTSNSTGMFTWLVSNGSAVPMGTFNDSVQVTWNASGPYTLSVSQLSASNNCLSNTQSFTAYAYPSPIVTGPVAVCADAQVGYSISNIAGGPFTWYVSPTQMGTIVSSSGNTVTILWHGSSNPGNSNTAWLHYGRCGDDSIAITISEPVAPVITQGGGLCAAGGVTLSTNATGSFSWSGPSYSSNAAVATNIVLPGIYTVVISNYNGTGCTVTATWNVPDIGRPVAHISASGPLNYCYPNLPNMNLVAAAGTGYSYAWYQVIGMSNVAVGGNSPTLPINSLTSPGTYTFFVDVTLNGCTVRSNYLSITISTNCAQPCNGELLITNISGCNPFTLTLAAGAPSGSSVVPGSTTIAYSNAPQSSGNSTITFDSVGYQQVSVCADISLPGGGTTRCCKDTVVLVRIAPKFLANNNCGVVTLTDLSTVINPCSIGSYSWTAGSFPGNLPLPAGVATFSSNTAASPVLTFTQSGTYIITQTITGCSCSASYQDTITVSVPNAAFSVSGSCVGTPVALNPGTPGSHYWNFGDSATSYVSPTSHAYGTAGPFTITHTVTDASGCTATATQTVNISPAPVCTVSYSGQLTFCAGGSLLLNACAGYSSYQWFNNGAPVGTGASYTATQTGNYWFTAVSSNNCALRSDTVSITVNPAPPAAITANAARCVGSGFVMSVPSCATCTYAWTDNGNPMPGQTASSVALTIGPAQVGTHNIVVTVVNTATGCTASGSLSLTFYSNPTVSISVSGSPAQLCSGNVYTLNASSGAASPAWAWTYNAGSFVLSTLPSLLASAQGTYTATVTDGVTGCKASASQFIQPSPDLSLFPMGCDTLCDTSKLFLPLPSNNGNLAGYTVTWYANAPPYANVIGTGLSIPLTALPLGNTNVSVIVVGPNGCADTSRNYSVTIKPCGPQNCSCTGGTWDTLYWQPVPLDDVPKSASAIITPVHPIKCGDSLGVIDCKQPIQLFASWACQPASCDSAVSWQLTGPVNLNGYMPFSTAGLPAGSYLLTLTGKCGDSVCNNCKIPFVIKCDTIPPPVDCCKGSYWASGPAWINSTTGAAQPIDCASGTSLFTISSTTQNCYTPYVVKGVWVCPDTCASLVLYQLLDAAGNVLLTSTGSLSIPASLVNGIYTVNIQAYCGGTLCATCRFRFRKDCKCDCPPGKNIQAQLTLGNISKPVKCGDKLPDIDCGFNALLSASYFCTPEQCPAALTYVLNGPSGTSTGSLPLQLNTLPPGTYSIMITAYCNGKLCRECVLTFTVKCPKIPDCCPKKIEVLAAPAQYSILPDSSGTLATQAFTFSGLTGPYTQVRAEVLQFQLSSNYNNECISCDNLPFTWGSLASGSLIGAVPALVQLFGGATTPLFNPVGTAVYQNPRVLSWSSGTAFAVSGPVTIRYLLPPLPKIDCCTLSVKLCIRFTFRDRNCRECSVLTCVTATLVRDEKGVYVLR